jgi:mono/diheme cytochrome c family protein
LLSQANFKIVQSAVQEASNESTILPKAGEQKEGASPMGRLKRLLLFGLAAIAGIVVLALGILYGASQWRLNQRYEIAVAPLAIPADAATIERGRHLVESVAGCADCHGEDLSGQVFLDAPPFRLVAANLTAGGVTGVYSDADWVRAVRYGVRPDGRPLLFMPVKGYSQFSDDDLAAILAYVKSKPPVDNQPGSSSLHLLGRVLLLAGQYQLPADTVDPTVAPPAAPPTGRTVEYGQYLAAVGNCRDCHGENLTGMPPMEPGALPSANLTLGGRLQWWSEADFINAMRTGVRPDGSQITDSMPWRVLAKQTDDELGAIYRYLQSLPKLPFNAPVEG